MIRKKIYIAALLLCCILMSSCERFRLPDERGLEEFSVSDSECNMNLFLLPDSGLKNSEKNADGSFINMFDYEEGNYYRHNDGGNIFSNNSGERTLVYLKYSDEIYLEAKEYAIDNLILSEESICEQNGYIFFINKLATAKDPTERLSGDQFPYYFLSFSYNDEKQTLVFFGIMVGKDLHNQIAEEATDWPAFLEKYYGEWYSFS